MGVSKRRKYWTVVVQDMACFYSPSINSLFPAFMKLSGTSLAQLKLTDEEMDVFTNIGKGLAAQFVNPGVQADTALHM